MSAGVYNTKIEAGRNLVRRIRWTTNDGTPIPLGDYVRLIYNVQTRSTPITEVLTVDSDDNPTWLFVEDDGTEGYLRLAVPGNEVPYVGSPNNLYEHELVLIDASGGPTPLFRGDVQLTYPVAVWT